MSTKFPPSVGSRPVSQPAQTPAPAATNQADASTPSQPPSTGILPPGGDAKPVTNDQFAPGVQSSADKADASQTAAQKLVAKGMDWLEGPHEKGKDFSLPGGFSVGIHAFEKVMDADEVTPKTDKGQSKDIPKSNYEAAHKEPHVWIKDGFLVDATFGLNKSLPLVNSGAVSASVNVGFSAFAKFVQMAPYPLNARAVGAVAKDITVDLPLTADKMQHRPQGYTFDIIGAGTGVVSGSVNAGYTVAAGPVDIGLSAGVSASETKTGQFLVSGESIDGKSQVYVNFAKLKDTTKNVDLNAGIGLNTDRLTQAAKEKLPSGKLADMASKKGFDFMAQKVSMVSASIDSSHSIDDLKETDEHFRFDLSKPPVAVRMPDGSVKQLSAADAYNGLVKLDDKTAVALSRIPNSGVVMFQAGVTQSTKTDDLNVKFGPWNPLKNENKLLLRQERDVEQGGVHADKGPISTRDVRDAQFTSSHELLGHQRTVHWEGWSLKDKIGDRKSFFSLTVDRKDGATNPQDIRNFKALGEATGAALTVNKEPSKTGNFIGRIVHGKYGTEANEHVKVTWTQEGVKNWRNASDDAVADAFGRECQRMSESKSPPGFAVADPDLRARAIALMDGYVKLGDTQPSEKVTVNGTPMTVQQARLQLADQYQKLTRGSIRKDSDFYPQFQQIMRAHTTMKAEDEAKWGETLAHLGSEQKGNPWLFMATMSHVAGKENCAMEDASLKGKPDKDGNVHFDLSMTDPMFADQMKTVTTMDQIAAQKLRSEAMGVGQNAVQSLDPNDADNPVNDPSGPP